ncbi:MAG: GNAT family N-acetyltransferase, partial [Pseudomonadota bacterium]
RCGEVALLRSVATSADLRGRGVARALVQALEALAVEERFQALYLLTESAEGYFESQGYLQVDRSSVPVAVRASRQFSSLCPDSAVVMCKRLLSPA